MSAPVDPLSLSADLLYEVKTGSDPDGLCERLATIDRERLETALSDRRRRLAFWINCFNSYSELLAEQAVEPRWGVRLERWKVRTRDRIPIAGVWISLSDVKHGMLRGSKHPWGLGYLKRPFPSSFERQFRLEGCDARIHFALSRGSDRCPPTTVFSPTDVDEELDVATAWYLEENVRLDRDHGVATVPRWLLWYHGDFGGRAGIERLLARHGVISSDESVRIDYRERERSPNAVTPA